MGLSAISFEQENKIIDAMARELVKHDGKDWNKLQEWQQAEYKRKVRPLFNAMYNVLREG